LGAGLKEDLNTACVAAPRRHGERRDRVVAARHRRSLVWSSAGAECGIDTRNVSARGGLDKRRLTAVVNGHRVEGVKKRRHGAGLGQAMLVHEL